MNNGYVSVNEFRTSQEPWNHLRLFPDSLPARATVDKRPGDNGSAPSGLAQDIEGLSECLLPHDREFRLRALNLIFLLTALTWAAHSQARELSVPLTIGLTQAERQVATELGMADGGTAVLAHDECNRIQLSDLSLSTDPPRLRASMAISATVGAVVFGECRGPGSLSGRMLVNLLPSASTDGTAVRLEPKSVEVRHSDGSSGIVTRPARVLAEELVLPRLDDVRVDLGDRLAQLNGFIDSLLPRDGSAPSIGPARLGTVGVSEDGITASLVFRVEAVESPGGSTPEAPLSEDEMAQWRRLEDELDGFLTHVIASLASRAPDRGLRLELLGVLLDSRLAIAQSLAADSAAERDPVRRLFVESWERLRPHAETLAQSEALPGAEGLQLAAFIAGADAIRALDELGPSFGIDVSRDGLRRLARMLLADDAPAAFTPLPLAVDEDLKRLFHGPAGAAKEHRAPPPGRQGIAGGWWQWLVASAHADTTVESPADVLRGMLPRLAGLDDYLGVVAELLDEAVRAHLANDPATPPAYRGLLDPLVRATAWKETCWRHYLDNAEPPSVIRSPVGAVGMMQINQRVWRGLYDMERLETDVAYNVNAGIEILEHYLVDYALRRGEHEHPGGTDNLVRATYAAYNGGPGQMPRYRSDSTPARLRAIDEAFWRAFEQMKRESWPDVGSCYPV